MVRNKAVYLALGVLPDGSRDILGLWIENTEGAKFWMKVFNDLKTRGHFPSDQAASKLIWLALRNITADWGRAAHDWKAAMNQFAILYEDRSVVARRRSTP